MPTYALLDKNVVVDVVSCDAKIVLEYMFPEYLVVEETEQTGKAFIGSDILNQKFRLKKPYKSWIWKDNGWFPPKEIPTHGKAYIWNENNQAWSEVK
jgi:hypothetical protein